MSTLARPGRVIGIDASSSMTGVALVEGDDLIDTWVWEKDKSKSGIWNLNSYFRWLRDLLVESWEEPRGKVGLAMRANMACIEYLTVSQNAQTTRVLSHYQAASVLACKEVGVTVIEGRVSSARREALGRGNMSKDECWNEIRRRYPDYRFRPKTRGGMDETDAIVLALAGPGLVERS